MIDWIRDQLLNNQIFAGVALGSVVGSLFYMLKGIPRIIQNIIVRQLTCELTIYNDDDVYGWVNDWLAQRPEVKKTKRLHLSTKHNQGGEADSNDWSITLGPGKHIIWYAGRPVRIERRLEETKSGTQRQETLLLSTLGPSNKILKKIITAARQHRDGEPVTPVYYYANYWRRVGTKTKRPLDTVVLPEGQIEGILSDIEWFSNSKAWYQDRGIPYRRGYLLYGPPGCGKSSLIFALASHLDRPVHALNLGGIHSDNSLLGAMMDAPTRSIVVIEDIDALNVSKKRAPKPAPKGAPIAEDQDMGITLSGLLNVIDGLTASEGRILFMTTNHVDELDPALVRPGRVDVRECIDKLGPEEATRFFERFYGVKRRLSLTIAAAELQIIFMRHPDNPESAMAELEEKSMRSAAE